VPTEVVDMFNQSFIPQDRTGRVVFEGTPRDLAAERASITGRYLAGRGQ
jgi:excinuclease UvrABC ATPase subunit